MVIISVLCASIFTGVASESYIRIKSKEGESWVVHFSPISMENVIHFRSETGVFPPDIYVNAFFPLVPE